jgi:hypothetical protein
MRTKLSFMLLVCLLLAVSVLPAHKTLAKGDISKALITGPGLKAKIEITDRSTLDALISSAVVKGDDPSGDVTPAPIVGIGYDIVPVMVEPNGESFELDRFRYFPNAQEKGGYFFHIGAENSAMGSASGHWFNVPARLDVALRGLLEKHISATNMSSALSKVDLGSAPSNCKLAAKYDSDKAPVNNAVHVSTITWAQGFTGSTATLQFSDKSEAGEHGWSAPLQWWIKEYSANPVQILGRNLTDDTPLWFQVAGQDQPSTVIAMDAHDSKLADRTSLKDFATFSSTVFIPRAGCYEIEVHWGFSTQKTIFAAGR